MKIFKPKFWESNNIIAYLIWPLTLVTKIIILLKNTNNAYKAKVKSICVGNIYLGGTGKTQLVIKISEILKKKHKVFIIKKNYKNQIDEQKLIKKKTNLILAKTRFDGINKIKKNKKNLAVFDDGLQDKSLHYDIKIACFSSVSGIGNGKLLPAGPLREELSELKKYDAVFINGKKNNQLLKKIKSFNNKIKVFNGRYILKNRKSFKKNEKFLAFCGIGTPENFFNLLKESKIKVKKKIIFPDHHNYNEEDIKKLNETANKNNLKLVTTEKDNIKLYNFKKFDVKVTNVDLQIENISSFKKFLTTN